ncbi:radical SAM protein [bacterium]|nr:radical SAM protein [bacterium]
MIDHSLPLFGDPPDDWQLPDDAPARLRDAEITYKDSSSILTKASGFMGEYDYTLNPYSGCEFGCTYCYAAFFTRDQEKQDSWGRWVVVKKNAIEKLRRMRTTLEGKKVYMSSVTDPYQGIEARLRLVRAILSHIVPQQPRLVVQTRSALVKRDIDLFQAIDHVQVNMTVTTDNEDIRAAYEPNCAKIEQRLKAITEVAASGVRCGITLTPLLPVADVEEFATRLLDTGVSRFVVQPFHSERGRFVAGTREKAMDASRRLGWTDARYAEVLERLQELIPGIQQGKDGFAPV